ncbi:MAG: FAD-dependent oxidoreductase [Nanoarchaeota archaeon]|mgnify:CR=1 FL=1
MVNKKYEIIIIGGGVAGTSLLYVLSNYTNIKNIALIEKCKNLGQVNSYRNNNSQTLHFGDIETNYSFEKAKKVNEASVLLKNYLDKNGKDIYIKTSKMVLAIGDEQINFIKNRIQKFKKLFPKLELINKKRIEEIEPLVVKGRNKDENIAALYTEDGYAINYDELSESFIQHSEKSKIEIKLCERVKKLIKKENYAVITDKGEYDSKIIIVCSGAHSLVFAKKLNYGLDYGILPVAGSFFGTKKKFLNGKVYTIQMEKLPFAAIHGDPFVDNTNETRFGPTAKVLPLLERHDYSSILDFFRTSFKNLKGILSLFKILSDLIVLKYVIKNIIYDIPLLGKRQFIKEVRKIVPTIKLNELNYKKGYGGIRPQLVNWEKMNLEMGDAKIYGKNIIFNITPSPGASVCLKNAEIDARKIIEFFKKNFNTNFKFDENKFEKDLK